MRCTPWSSGSASCYVARVRMPAPTPKLAAWPLLALSGLGATCCQSCHEDRPYTPFGVASSIPGPSSSAPRPAASAGAPDAGTQEFQPKAGLRIEGSPTSWQRGTERLQAPQGYVFVSGVVADFDGNGTEDAVAWLMRSAPGDGEAPHQGAALWYYPAGGEPRLLAEPPGFIPTSSDCTANAALAHTGPTTVTLELRASCSEPRLPRSPMGSLQVLAPARSKVQLWGARLAEPAPGESMQLAVLSIDRDGDGLDDIDVTVTVSATGSERPASARWVWLDRAAGPSRDDEEPAGSFARLGSVEQVRSSGKNTSKPTLSAVENVRRLYSSICAESGTERLWAWDGAPLRCGPLGSAVDRLSHAELQASLKQGDVIRAFSVLERDGWYWGPMSKEKRAELSQLLRRAVTPRDASALLLPLPLRQGASGPQYSPLSFDAEGSLWLQTAYGVLRRVPARSSTVEPLPTPGTLDELPNNTVTPWRLEPVGPRGDRWTATIQACARSEVALLFSGGSQYGDQQVATSILAARPGSCSGRVFEMRRPPAPLGWSADGLTALVGGRVVELGALAAIRSDVPAGSPLSIDGRSLVLATELGLLVIREHRSELWTLERFGPTSDLHHCVIANGASRAACIQGTKALLISPDNAGEAADSKQ